MKKLLFLFLSVALFSCSSDSDGESNSTTGQTLSFNGQAYEFDHVYVFKFSTGPHLVCLTKGEMSMTMEQLELETTYNDNFKRIVSFNIGENMEGNHTFKIIDPDEILTEYPISFNDDYEISNGQPTSFNTIFGIYDNMSNQSRVKIVDFENGTYSFDFNVITAAGILTGNYQGEITKINF